MEPDLAKKFLDIAGLIFVALNEKGEITLINRNGCRILGYEEKELIGRNWFDTCLPTRLRNDAKLAFQRLMAGEIASSEHYANPVLTKSGTEKYISWHNTALTDEAGSPIGMLSSGLDVTAHREAEGALRRSEANLKKVQKIARLGSYERKVPFSSDEVTWSEETYRIFDVDPEEFQPTWSDFRALIHPEDRERVGKILAEAVEKIIPFDFEYRVVRRDGSVRHVESLGEPVCDGTGRVVKLVGTLVDITERKQAEEALRESETRLRAILDTAVDGIITINENGLIESMNAAAERLFGYRADEMIGENVQLFMPWPHRNRHDAYIANYVKTGEKKIIGIGREVVGQRKDGSTFPLHISVSEFFLGERRMFTALVRDITEQKALQEQSLQTERFAIIGKMAAKVAHEIRNPLSSISLNAELLEDEIASHGSTNNEEAKSLIESMIREIDRVTSLTDEYLQFSRFPESRPTKGNFRELINEIMEFLVSELKRQNIDFEFRDSNPTFEVCIDRTQFRRVLLNIIRNAIESMPEGGRLTIWTEKTERSGVINITDTGAGIPEEKVDHIFEPFFTTKTFGTGLGLAITQQIVHEHGGQILCESKVGEGTTFRVEIPLFES